MSRIRMIHPDFCDSVSLNNCSEGAQLLFVKTWTLADDEGRLLGDVPWLASRAYPRGTDAMLMIPMRLDELEREGLIQRYVVEDQDYLHVTNWKSRQRIYHPTRSKLPAPPNFGKDSRKIRESQLNSLDDNDKDENSGESADDFVGNDGGPGEMTDQELKRAARDVYVRARARGNYGVTLRALEFGRRLNLEGRASRSAAGGPADTGQNDLEAARATQAALGEKSTG